MKLENAFVVTGLVTLREKLVRQRDHEQVRGHVGDDTLDPVMIRLIRPVITAELDRRVAVLDGELRALGVVLPA